LRIGVHPPDARSARLMASIATTFSVALRKRRPASYSALLNASARGGSPESEGQR
jgi:hypothetical protein